MLTKYFRLLCLVFFVTFLTDSFAQEQLSFKHLTINEGLSQNTVNSIVQDRKGLVWIATYDGLNRYDGYDFVVYTHQGRDSTSLSDTRVNVVFEDRRGNLWVGTSNGLNLFNPLTESFKVYKNNSQTRYGVFSIKEDHKGNLWIGTNEGLKFFNHQTGKLSSIDLKDLEMEKTRIQSIYIDQSGLLWLGLSKGVKIYNPINNRFVPVPAILSEKIKDSWIRSICLSPAGELWIATEAQGIFRYQKKNEKLISYTVKDGLASNIVRDVIFIDNHAWIGTRLGLSILDLASGKIKNHSHSSKIEPSASLTHSSVRCLFQDKAKNVWIGTYSGGINLVYGQKNNFTYKGQKRGDVNWLSNAEVNAIVEDGENTFWIATDGGGGLNFWNKITGEVQVYKDLSSNSLYNTMKGIIRHPDSSKLWISTSGGVVLFDKRKKTFKKLIGINRNEEVAFNQSYCLSISSMGLWIGSNYNGISLVSDDKVLKSYTHIIGDSKTINSNGISCLLADEKDGLWIGHHYAGLNYLNVKSGKMESFYFDKLDKRSLSSNAILCLFTDSKKRLWVGTDGGGLNYFDAKTKKFSAINNQNGLYSQTIYAIEEDNHGALWVSTNRGIFKINLKEEKTVWNSDDLEITNYTEQDGLHSNQFLKGSVYKSKAGEVFFGGISGLTSFFPDKIAVNQSKPDVVFTDFSFLNKKSDQDVKRLLKRPIDLLDEVELAYDDAFFTIKYSALNYIYPERNKYAYKLKGFSNESWHYVDNQRSATYTNLNPGTYVFMVKAANNSGVWNNVPRTLKITVLPPWWKTYWAYAFYTLVASLLLYIFNYYAKYTERLKNKMEYEADAYKKDQEASRKKLNFFINISHEIKTPITMIMAPLQKLMSQNENNTSLVNSFHLMNKSCQRLLLLIEQLLDFRSFEVENSSLKASEGNLVEFTKELVIVFSHLAKSKDIELEFSTEIEESKVWFDQDKIEKVLCNVISNAIKYTPAFGKVLVTVKTVLSDRGEMAVISVKDNGCGISKERLKDIFYPFNPHDNMQNNITGHGIGLAFAKELIELHHGTIEVESETADIGKTGYTCFDIQIPLGNAYLSTLEIDYDHLGTENITNYKNYKLNQRTRLKEKKLAITSHHDKKRFVIHLIEDNHDVINFLAECFEEDFTVIKSNNGRDGFNLAVEEVPDIIISDVMMPELNGMDLCSKLKQDIRTSHIPVILLTAKSPFLFKIEGLNHGADDYITKPFNFDLLEIKVWNLLESYQKIRRRYQKEIVLELSTVAAPSYEDKFLEKVMLYIDDHLSDVLLNVEDLSEHVSMSRGNLYKKIKALTNKSPLELIRFVRLKRAAELLKQQKMYVNEVAFQVGFQDVNYFRKCFKEEFGVSPTKIFEREWV